MVPIEAGAEQTSRLLGLLLASPIIISESPLMWLQVVVVVSVVVVAVVGGSLGGTL